MKLTINDNLVASICATLNRTDSSKTRIKDARIPMFPPFSTPMLSACITVRNQNYVTKNQTNKEGKASWIYEGKQRTCDYSLRI